MPKNCHTDKKKTYRKDTHYSTTLSARPSHFGRHFRCRIRTLLSSTWGFLLVSILLVFWFFWIFLSLVFFLQRIRKIWEDRQPILCNGNKIWKQLHIYQTSAPQAQKFLESKLHWFTVNAPYISLIYKDFNHF